MSDFAPALLFVVLGAVVTWCLRAIGAKPYKPKTPARPPESPAMQKARETIENQGKADADAIVDDLKAQNSLQRLVNRANRRRRNK